MLVTSVVSECIYWKESVLRGGSSTEAASAVMIVMLPCDSGTTSSMKIMDISTA